MSEGPAPHRCVLCKDNRFAVPPFRLDIADYAVVELLCCPFTSMHPSGEVFAAASAMDNEDKVDFDLTFLLFCRVILLPFNIIPGAFY